MSEHTFLERKPHSRDPLPLPEHLKKAATDDTIPLVDGKTSTKHLKNKPDEEHAAFEGAETTDLEVPHDNRYPKSTTPLPLSKETRSPVPRDNSPLLTIRKYPFELTGSHTPHGNEPPIPYALENSDNRTPADGASPLKD